MHIKNVNPEATENMVRRAFIESANNMQDKPKVLKEEQVKVDMVRRREEDPTPVVDRHLLIKTPNTQIRLPNLSQ